MVLHFFDLFPSHLHSKSRKSNNKSKKHFHLKIQYFNSVEKVFKNAQKKLSGKL